MFSEYKEIQEMLPTENCFTVETYGQFDLRFKSGFKYIFVL